MKLEDLLNQDMGSTIDWLEMNSHKYNLVERNKSERQERVLKFIESWDGNMAELIERSDGLCREFFDSLSDLLSEE